MKHLLALILVASLASGCLDFGPRGRLGEDCPAAPEPNPPADGKFTGRTLRILSHGSFASFASVKEAFENQTGATLVLIEATDTGAALQQALLGAGNPVADILYGVDNALFFSEEVLRECLFMPYDSPRLDGIDAQVVPIDQFRVEGRVWATPVDHGYVSVNYDVRLKNRTGSEPANLRDLAQPHFARQFVTQDPRESSPGLGFLLATIATFGENGAYPWQSYWRELLDNGALVVPDWTTAYVYHYTGGYGASDASNRNDRSIVTSYTTSPAVEVYYGAPAPPGRSLEPEEGVFHQIETMGILRGTPQPDLARAWIDFTLSPTFQSTTAPDMAVYPVITGTPIPASFDQHATHPAQLQPARLSAQDIGTHLDRWLDQWEDLYRAKRS